MGHHRVDGRYREPLDPAIVTTLLAAGAELEALQGTSAYRRLRSLLDQT